MVVRAFSGFDAPRRGSDQATDVGPSADLLVTAKDACCARGRIEQKLKLNGGYDRAVACTPGRENERKCESE